MKTLRHAILLALAGLLAATTMSVSSAAAEDGEVAQPRHRLWAAIAISKPDTTVTYSYNYGTKRRAKRVAVRKCKRNSNWPGQCFSKAWARNRCVAVAGKLRRHSSGRISIRRAAAGFGKWPRPAKRNALKNLPGSGGRILATVCPHRHL